MKRAYSYIRFSTPEQLKGKSLERQTEAARLYCKQHGLELDTELSLQDLGVSAFRGKNADTGALGSFLKGVHSGAIPPGSFLLIESFDRLSREAVYDAQLTLQNIINAGITVVTLMDGKQYNVDILRADPVAIIQAVVLMMRAHEESATKSKRVADAWRRKREALTKNRGIVLTARTPGWLRLDQHRVARIILARANIVRRIFEEFVSGQERSSIVKTLNQERVPTFGGGRWWSMAYVTRLLANRAVLGEFQPGREQNDETRRRRIRVPDGPPIKNYWPPIIDEQTFNKAQKRLAEVRRKRIVRPPHLKNVLAGLARCPECDGLMDRRARGNALPALICARARAGAGCVFKSVRLSVLEAALATGAAKLAAEVPDTSAELRKELEAARAKLAETTTLIEDLATVLSDTPSKTIAQRIQAHEAEAERLRAEIDRLNAQIQYGSARRIRDAVAHMRAALQWHATDPTDVAGVNAALRECFSKIVVDYHNSRLEMHWKHGQMTALPY